jgi:hypothetical protein
MAVSLGGAVLGQYRRFSLYNSPFVAHDDGSAVDLYPPADAESVPSPVGGEVLDTRTVSAPPKPYAEPEDHLVLVDTGDHVARLMHVEPRVDPGATVARGDELGRPVRAGFFAPWVPNHLHLEFRPADADPYRASGSLRLAVAVEVEPLAWDGTGTVVAAGETWARLDAPEHPAPGERFVGLESGGGLLDGGLPHYDGGGLLGGGRAARLAGERVGTVDGRDVAWDALRIQAEGEAVTGVACRADSEVAGVKLVGRDISLSVGDEVTVTVRAGEAGD